MALASNLGVEASVAARRQPLYETSSPYPEARVEGTRKSKACFWLARSLTWLCTSFVSALEVARLVETGRTTQFDFTSCGSCRTRPHKAQADSRAGASLWGCKYDAKPLAYL